MKLILVSILFLLNSLIVFGQNDGDYRTRRNGNWHKVDRWEVFHNGAWRLLGNAAAGPYQNVLPTSASGEIIIRDDIGITENISLNQLIINSNRQLTIGTGVTVTVIDDFTQTPILVQNNATLTNFGILDLQSQLSATPCIVNGVLFSSRTILTSDPSLLIFNSGSAYDHRNGSGGNIPLATWDLNSTCIISGMTGSNANPPGNLGQSFGQFTWNTPSMGNGVISLNGGLQTVNGNLRIVTTGNPARYLRFANGGAGYNLTIGGNLLMESGYVILGQSLSSTTSITVAGDILITGGILNLGSNNNSPINVFLNGNFVKTGGGIAHVNSPGTGTIRFDGGVQTYTNNSDITSQVSFAVENGSTLDLGTTYLSGSGNFTLLTGGTVNIGSTDAGGAIQQGTNGGNIRMSGSRNFQTGSNLIYNSGSPQFMGNGHPPLPHTTITNTNGVTMVSDATINGNLILGDNNLLIENNTLTLGGDLLRVGGALGVRTTSSVVINGSGDFGDLILSFTEFPNNPINNLTINRVGGTVFLGSSLTVAGAFTHTAGNFSLGQFSAYTLTLLGNFVQSGGASLSTFDNSGLVIAGAGTMPANVNILGPNLFSLTMDRPSRTFSSSSPLTLTNLNLFNGVVSNPSLNIVMVNDGVVTRRSGGSLTSVLGTVSPGDTFDLIYDLDTDVSSGNELPFDFTRLGNLVKQGVASLELTHPIQVNKTFNVVAGTFDIGSNNDVAIVEDLIVNGTLLSGESKVSFIGTTNQQIDAATPLTLYDIEVNKTSASVSLSATTSLDIENSIQINSASDFNAGADQLRLLSTATRTANVAPIAAGGSISGTVVAQRYLPKEVERAEYFHLASPFTDATFAEWDDDTDVASILRYNEATAKYNEVVNLNSTIVNGRGYVVDISEPLEQMVEASGTLQQGNVNVNVTTQTPGVVSGNFGWNLIGNPYASTIDWDNVAINETLVYNAIYMWDNFGNSAQGNGVGISVSYVDDVGTPAGFGGEIAPGQAFFVKALQSSAIPFTESAKISDTNTTVFRKKEVPNVLRIVVKGDGVNDETVVRLREGATDKFDGKYDAYKFLAKGFHISTLTSDNIKAVINAFGAPTTSCNNNISIVADDATTGSFALNFTGIESFDPSITLSLIDLVENKTVNIRNNPTYSFIITNDNLHLMSKRFELSIGTKSSVSPPNVELSIDEAGILTSSMKDGNLWYLNGILLEGEEHNTLEAFEPGVYSVENRIGNCSTTASLEVLDIGENGITVFPNPTPDKVLVRVKTTNNNVVATLVNNYGIEIGRSELAGEGDFKETEFNLVSQAAGIYHIRVLDGQKVTNKKIAKLK